MTPLMWIAAAFGVAAWGWLLHEVTSPHGYFGREACTCRKGAKCLNCIERDQFTKTTERRRNGEAVQTSRGAEAS